MVELVQGVGFTSAYFPIQQGDVQNPYKPFTYTIPVGGQETIYYNYNYFRVLELSGGQFLARFGSSGSEAEFPYAGLAYDAPVVLDRVTIRNGGATPMTFTVGLAVGRILDDSRQFSGAVTVANTAVTPLFIEQGTGVILDTKEEHASGFTTGQVAVGVAATLILAANTTVGAGGRKGLTITAPATGDLYIGGAAVTVATGLRVPAGSSYYTENTAARYGVLAVAATVTYEEETY